MTPEQRAAAMDELEKLDRTIANLRDEIDPEDPECDWQESIREDLSEAVRKREALLQMFPEVKYWPTKFKKRVRQK